ncbi:MAG: sigma-54-dependent Fis family transcriptional regulator [Planctomycetes bacterium]|nr:sigma-54-dependent Fis family transcriptional regulator [Planctomycetota bacterium]
MAAKTLILVIDDDPDFQELVGWMLNRLGYQACAALSAAEVPTAIGRHIPEVILLDWHLGDVDGTTLIESLREKYPLTSIIFATAHSTPEVAAAAIKLGAFDFLTKPLDEAKLTVTVAKAAEHHRLLSRLRNLESGAGGTETGFAGLIGVSPQMRTVYSIIQHVAPTDVNVMICGESGTGKELIASAIHECSDRARGPFIPLNMASIPGDLAEATLFGHEKGAFTGADRDRPGAVGEAVGGTLFLDEITEMPLLLQGKLLRFLQERTYRPVGGRKDLKADLRVVSATNRDPWAAVQDKLLREDLYYRLNVVPIMLPPLREREGDIVLLASHFVIMFSKQYGKQFTGIDRTAVRLLESCRWPGNVRQLMHAMQRVVILNNGTTVEPHMLPPDLLAEGTATAASGTSAPTFPATAAWSPAPLALPPRSVPAVAPTAGADSAPSLAPMAPAAFRATEAAPAASGCHPSTNGYPFASKEDIISMDELERLAISRAIELCGGSAFEAAEVLGISSATIYRKLKRYGLASD